MFKKLLGMVMVAAFFACAPLAMATEKYVVWDQKYDVEGIIFLSGSSPFSRTLDNVAVSDQGSGLVRFTSTDHGYALGSYITLSGTTNYDGMYEIQARTSSTFDVYAVYVAETPDATDDIFSSFQTDKAYQFIGFELTFNTAPTTSENLTVTKDAGEGSAYDTVPFDQDMSGVTTWVCMFDVPIRCQATDKLVFTYDNTDGRTYGIKVIIRRTN